MKQDKLRSLLSNIASLKAIPVARQTPKQQKAIFKMQASVGQSKLMQQSKGPLPEWWVLLEKRYPVVRRQIAACVAAVPNFRPPGSASTKTVGTSKRVESCLAENEISLEDAEDAMGLPRGTLEVCMDAD